jgi:endoglucanase
MRTPRTLYKISQSEPGTEIAAETAAAMAAASIVFRETDRTYSRKLLNKAKLVSLAIVIPNYNQHLFLSFCYNYL